MRRVGAGLAVAAVLLASACDSTPAAVPPTVSPSAPTPDGVVLDEHDGYLAFSRNCERLDWAPLRAFGHVDSDPYAGYNIVSGQPPVAHCNGQAASGAGAASITLTLLPNTDYAESACAVDADRREEPWDGVDGSAEVSAHDGSGRAALRLRSGVLCVDIRLTITSGTVDEMADPEAELRSIALGLAANARATSLRESYPELPVPAAVPVADHDGFVAMPDVCRWVDWSPVARIGAIEPDQAGGYYLAQNLTPAAAEAFCSQRFVDGGDPLTVAILHATIWPTEEDAAEFCDFSRFQPVDGGNAWDFAEAQPADDGVKLHVRDAVLCVRVSVWPGDSVGAGVDLTAAGLVLAGDIREGSLRANHPELPSPSAT